GKPPNVCVSRRSHSKRRASFRASELCLGFDIAWPLPPEAEASSDDVHHVPGLSEPHGPHGAMADRCRGGTEISQSGAAGHLGPSVRAIGCRAGANLADFADL